MILVFVVLAVVVAMVIWERSDRALFRKVFFALYNYALKKKEDLKSKKPEAVSINILEIMDETDVTPKKISGILSQMEKKEFITMKSNIVKLTPVGVAYFKFKYLDEQDA